MVHNYYQHVGGEDNSFAIEASLLERHGHQVARYTRHNDELAGRSGLSLAALTVWNRTTYRDIRELVHKAKTEVVIFQNTFPLISPAGYYAARHEGAAVVQVLRNYRLLCPASNLFRDGAPCELCVPRSVKWPAVWHKCYKRSRAATGVVSLMLLAHKLMGTWSRAIDLYVALTQFARGRYIAGGLPADRILVRTNFLEHDPGIGDPDGGYALFAGRLTLEKGVMELLEAWAIAQEPRPLRIVGDGPMRSRVLERIRDMPSVEWLGQKDHNSLLSILGAAEFLVFPSIWYEGMPRIIIEAFARGVPVIAYDLGAAREMIDSGVNGLRVPAEGPFPLAEGIQWFQEFPVRLAEARLRARETYEAHYTSAVGDNAMTKMLKVALERAEGRTRSKSWLGVK